MAQKYVEMALTIRYVALALLFCYSNANAEVVKMKIVDHISSYGYSNFGADSSSKLVAKVKPSEFSGPDHLKSLFGKCYTLKINDYKYKLCPFNNVTQHEQTYRWNPYSGILGIWKEWKVINNTFHSMIMENGDSCGTSNRQVQVVMLCGTANNLTSVAEPQTCHYRMTFETPLVCHEDSMLVYPRLNETLRNEWDEIERQYHDEEITEKGYKLYLQKLFWKAGLVKDSPDLYKKDSFQGYESLETCNAEYKTLLDEVKILRQKNSSK